ncbi:MULTISPECIES: Ig-like domain-containing protein [unclassified Rathayibacter]|uniref:Ig-like domain-containing protein n=1 Tax=unclassified Rathayibacter TaxID=2609250 RepID=UPI0015E1ED68|nr:MULTISPECIES: Ig-like domain-containing protein [unclassified Rathayibacter]
MRRRHALLPGALTGLLLASGLVAGGPAAAPAAAAPVAPAPAAPAPAPDRPVAAPDAEPTVIEPEADATTQQAALALDADFVDVEIPARAQVQTHRVTIALVAPQGTVPGGYTTADAVRALDLVDRFYSRETSGAIRFELDQVVDWQVVDQPIGCTNTGGLQDWIAQRTGWQRGPGKHLVAMVPEGDPCPNWANGEQSGDPDDGGRAFQPGPDAYFLAHELGHNLSLPHAYSVNCATTRDYASTPLPADCRREEYGNRTDVMGGAWSFLPLSSPSLARLGTLPNTRQPVCGAPRTTTLDTLGAGPAGRRALTWNDPQDTGIRYWAQYNDRADTTSDGGAYTSPFQVRRDVSGVQILRSNPGQPYAGDLLERPGDASEANEFVLAGESAVLNSGMSVRVDRIDELTRTATVTVTVPCTDYVGDIAPLASSTSASYTSPWTSVGAVADGAASTIWGSWPRVGEQHVELRWPSAVTVDSASVLFASDAADADGRGLIPARSWRVEHLVGDVWTPVSGAAPGRERDVLNRATFAPVTTTALRLVFTAWGAGEYGGSTGVAEIEVNGIALAASAEARGTLQSVPTATTRDLAQSVLVRDSSGRALAGRSVGFAITGPAAFESGATTAAVLSGADGVAALPRIRTGSTAGTVSITARVDGVTTALAGASVAPGASVTAKATSRLILGKVVVTVTATNTGRAAADLTVVTPYGTASSAAVAPGATVTKVFRTGKSSIAAGTGTVTAVSGASRASVSVVIPRA